MSNECIALIGVGLIAIYLIYWLIKKGKEQQEEKKWREYLAKKREENSK